MLTDHPPAHSSQQPCSALEDIEKKSQALLEKGVAARFIDKGEDSKEVARLIERLREAISYYQVSWYWIALLSIVDAKEQISQQQAIYEQIVEQTRGQRQTGRNDLPGRVRELLNGW